MKDRMIGKWFAAGVLFVGGVSSACGGESGPQPADVSSTPTGYEVKYRDFKAASTKENFEAAQLSSNTIYLKADETIGLNRGILEVGKECKIDKTDVQTFNQYHRRWEAYIQTQNDCMPGFLK